MSTDFDSTGLHLTMLTLCDFANVREGMINVVSGGITRIAVHGEFPVSVDSYIAMSIYVQPHRVDEEHEGRITLRYPDTTEEIARFDFQFSVNGDRFPGEGLFFPVALPMSGIAFPHVGQIDLSVALNGQPAGLVSFWLSDATATTD